MCYNEPMMAAKDVFHDTVKHALVKDGWRITHDPLVVRVGQEDFEIDLGAEQLIGAEKGKNRIAVEIKSFLAASKLYQFHGVLGQILNYELALEEAEPDRILYLAIPIDIYHSFFRREFIERVVKKYALRLIAFDPTTEEIAKWIQ